MRGAGRCGARLCSWDRDRGSPPLPSPARRFPRRSPPWMAASARGCPALTIAERRTPGSGAALAKLVPLAPGCTKGAG